jgi:hypothetical protein
MRCAAWRREARTPPATPHVKIQGAVTSTTKGVELSQKVTQGLQEIVLKTRQVAELTTSVASASREQGTGIEQVNTAVTHIDEATQNAAAAAEQASAAAQELRSPVLAPPRSHLGTGPTDPVTDPCTTLAVADHEPALRSGGRPRLP